MLPLFGSGFEMRLTTLEIKGFKSFGDRVTIHFDKGVTSIVGPNGSGKSNVVDAIRWVLGEQKTRMLRSEKMENIIFNGTKTRKPANLAEVSLSFANTKNILPTEFSLVTITRKLYRTGDSEYLLNGVTCRLKDITDLFLDTGIGSDSYSIIELKMIDEIINDKNNTIKTLFEEAAGISKYKIRKKQTLQKLEETEGDLNRVNDILFEIEKNLKTLESQAKKTERYYKLKEQYKELSTQLAAITISGYKETFAKLQDQELKLQDEKVFLETQVDQSEAQLEELKLSNTDNEKHLSASQKALNEKVNIIRQIESEKKVKNERLKFLQDKEASLLQQQFNDKKYLEQLQDALKVLADDREREELLLKESEQTLRSSKTEADELKKNQTERGEQITSKNKTYQGLQEEIFKAEKTLAIQQTQKTSVLEEKSRIEKELGQKQQEHSQILQQLEGLEISLEHKEDEAERHRKEEEESTEAIQLEEASIKQVQDELSQVNRKLDSKQNEYNLTKSLVDSLEGFPESIKFLKKNASSVKNVPLLSDLVQCSQEYRICIENFLEDYMNYFVVDALPQAWEALEQLSKAAQGRAKFFILDQIPTQNKNLPTPKQAKPALDIVETDTKYRSLIEYLLHNVFIINDTSLPEETQEGITLLSQSGKFHKSRVALSGGSVGLFEGKKIGRAKNLEVLEKDIQSLTQEKAKQETSLSEKQEQKVKRQAALKDIQAKRQISQGELNRLYTQIATLKARSEQANQSLLTAGKRQDQLNEQLGLLENAGGSSEGSFSERIIQLKGERDALQMELNNLEGSLKALNEEVSIKTADYNQRNIAFLQQQNKLNTIVRDITFKSSQSESLSKSIQDNTVELDKAKAMIADILENATDSDDNMLNLYSEKEELEKAVNELEAVYYKAKSTIDEREGHIKELRKRKENNDLLVQSIKEKVTEIKIQLNSLKERLSVEFGVELESLMEQEAGPGMEEADLKDKVEKMRGQISNFGPINPMAIEAYNEINERYSFINKQKEDLVKAKESLLQTIHEVDSTAKEKFMEAFIQIRSNFITVFRSLFSQEDNCDLTLSDTSNPLEAEINIVAQPKGKRPLSINQLSGGEKTLTATALLFSIYLLKPAPFCIFDEVDAPLDDTNIDKFNKIIQRFSTDSQFIIITHNKRTMASTDIIYGVTMIEPGVTQVVPVDMREVA